MIANLGYPFFTRFDNKNIISINIIIKKNKRDLAYFVIFLATLSSFDSSRSSSKMLNVDFSNYSNISIEKVLQAKFNISK